jgi:hypothetical protein
VRRTRGFSISRGREVTESTAFFTSLRKPLISTFGKVVTSISAIPSMAVL